MQRIANPAPFMHLSRQLRPWVARPTAVLLRAGLMLAPFVAPRD